MLTFYDKTRGVYIHTDPDQNQRFESKDRYPKSKRMKVELEPAPILEQQEDKYAVKKITNKDICKSKLSFHLVLSDNDPSLQLLTDAFYTNVYEEVPYFLNATYICENEWDYEYFGRVLNRKVRKSGTGCDETCVLVNPSERTDAVNVVYTVIPKNYIPNLHVALCCQYNNLIVHANEMGNSELPVRVSELSDRIYMNNLSTSDENTFKTVLYACSRGDFHVTTDLYNSIFGYIQSFNIYCYIPVLFHNQESREIPKSIISTSGILLYKLEEE
jgi:hypothetical protein